MKRRSAVLLLCAGVLIAGTAAALPAAAATAANDCANPVLATGTTGWGTLHGEPSTRTAVTDHPVAQWEFTVANRSATTAGSYLPQVAVTPGQAWDFAVDARTPNDPARLRMAVDWYTPASGYLGHVDGPYQAVDGQRGYTRIAGTFTAPAGAARANVLVEAADLAPDSGYATTMCDYHPTGTGSPTPPPPAGDIQLTAAAGDGTATVTWATTRTDIIGWTVGRDGTDTSGTGAWSTDRSPDARSQQFNLLRNATEYTFTLTGRTAAGALAPVTVKATPGAATPPPGDAGTTAAALFNWGPPTAGDEFNDPATPLSANWNRQEGEADGCYDGHNHKGLRCSANITEAGGMVTVVGQPNGTTGLMQSRHSSFRGRWETRMRVDPAGNRDAEYHPVLLLWPVAEDWPVGGEVDYSESESSSSHVSFFLHYGADNSQTGNASGNGRKDLDVTAWHNYAVEWTSTCMRGYIDGAKWFEDCTASHLPPRAMKQSIQLDYFPDGSGISRDVRMNVDWTRFYPV